MSIKDTLLRIIGIGEFTNRDELMYELDEMSDVELEKALESGIDISDALTNAMCSDCKDAHGGSCPFTNDEPCPMLLKDWFPLPCRHERLLPEVTA